MVPATWWVGGLLVGAGVLALAASPGGRSAARRVEAVVRGWSRNVISNAVVRRTQVVTLTTTALVLLGSVLTSLVVVRVVLRREVAEPVRALREMVHRLAGADVGAPGEPARGDVFSDIGRRLDDAMHAARVRVLDSLSDPLLLLSLDGTIEGATPAMLELLGRAKQDLVGQKIEVGDLEHVLTEDWVLDELVLATGDPVPLELTGSVHRDADGRPTGILLAARDPRHDETVRLDGYDVVRLLGIGGMARVWLVRHRATGALHAVKTLRERSERLAGRLRKEGALQRELVHDHVVRVTDVVDTSLGPALLLEYVEGPTLAALLAEGKELSIQEVDALARGILAGEAAAHERGWVHRDLKPSNLLLAVHGDTIVPKVADFGLVKVLDDADAGSTTRAGPGTRRYMSLEQLTGVSPTAAMDVFALGAVLFELIDGRPAWPTDAAWHDALKSGSVPSPSRAGVPARMRDAVAAALAPAHARPADAAALLARWTEGEALEMPAFRPETVRRAASHTTHLPDEVLAAGALGAVYQEHLERCARCRAVALVARANEVSEEPQAHDALLCCTGTPDRAVLRRYYGRALGKGLASFPSVHEALHAAAALHAVGPPAGVALVVDGDEDLARALARRARPGRTLCCPRAVEALGGLVQAPVGGGGVWTPQGRHRIGDTELELFDLGPEEASAPAVISAPG